MAELCFCDLTYNLAKPFYLKYPLNYEDMPYQLDSSKVFEQLNFKETSLTLNMRLTFRYYFFARLVYSC